MLLVVQGRRHCKNFVDHKLEVCTGDIVQVLFDELPGEGLGLTRS